MTILFDESLARFREAEKARKKAIARASVRRYEFYLDDDSLTAEERAIYTKRLGVWRSELQRLEG